MKKLIKNIGIWFLLKFKRTKKDIKFDDKTGVRYFKIPTGILNKEQAEQEIAALKKDITLDDKTGEIYINGSKDLPHLKEYWIPTNI